MAKLIQFQFELSQDELLVLQMLSRHGAMQPSQLASETLLLPADLNKVLGGLADMRLVIVRPDETPDGRVVILTSDGREALSRNMPTQKSI